MSAPRLRLRVLHPELVIEHHANHPVDDSWIAVIRAPEGFTVIRQPSGDGTGEVWVGLYGDDPHGLDVPGMLASVVGPLASAQVPVFVTSTYHADLVLVPAQRLPDAIEALDQAGHQIVAE